MDPETMRRLVRSARVAYLGTVGAGGRPHVVPICFAAVGDVVYSAVDHKPKKGTRLQRVANLQATAHACVLVSEYDDDWSALWWVRLDGDGRVVDDPRERTAALASLGDKYSQYVDLPPTGLVLALDISRWSGWSAS